MVPNTRVSLIIMILLDLFIMMSQTLLEPSHYIFRCVLSIEEEAILNVLSTLPAQEATGESSILINCEYFLSKEIYKSFAVSEEY